MGAGVALMDPQLLTNDLASGRVTQVLDHSVAGMRNYYLVYPESHEQRRSIPLFRDWIQGQLAEE
jgi:LysR family glycine cleavage system transcriptional activator